MSDADDIAGTTEEETRQAMQQALAGAPAGPIAAAPSAKLDVYAREAQALLVPGISYEVARERVRLRMALEVAPGPQSADRITWQVTQSAVHDRLVARFAQGQLQSWLLQCINGKPGV